jgi:parallel beta-helix repeat protein
MLSKTFLGEKTMRKIIILTVLLFVLNGMSQLLQASGIGLSDAMFFQQDMLEAGDTRMTVIEDFNGDGIFDVGALNDDGTVSVYLNNGDGTFAGEVIYNAEDLLLFTPEPLATESSLESAADMTTYYIPGDPYIGDWDEVNRIYTLTEDVNGELSIHENDLTLDGNGKTVTTTLLSGVKAKEQSGVTIKNLMLKGYNSLNGYGFFFRDCSDITVTGNTISDFYAGIYFFSLHKNCNNNTVAGNTVSNCRYGIDFSRWEYNCNNNTLAGNTLSKNYAGIFIRGGNNYTLTGNSTSDNQIGIVLAASDNSILTGNTISNSSEYGFALGNSNNTQFYNNNLIDNTIQAYYVGGGSGNVFNLNAPTGGNYWSDWTSPDDEGDGFVDYPYTFDIGGVDNLPLTRMAMTPKEMIVRLIQKVISLNLKQGISNGLDAKLSAALQAIDDINNNNDAAAINTLQAFINAVEAQGGNWIPEAEANALIAYAQAIIAVLSDM